MQHLASIPPRTSPVKFARSPCKYPHQVYSAPGVDVQSFVYARILQTALTSDCEFRVAGVPHFLSCGGETDAVLYYGNRRGTPDPGGKGAGRGAARRKLNCKSNRKFNPKSTRNARVVTRSASSSLRITNSVFSPAAESVNSRGSFSAASTPIFCR